MPLTVVVRSGELDEAPSITFDSPRVVIGRGEGCDVRLPDPSVSHRHASIRQRGSDYILLDEGSANGTFVGPVRLSAQAPRVVRSGDRVRIGRVWIELRIEQALPTKNPQLATKELALALVESALSAQGGAGVTVTITEGPDAGATLVLEQFERGYVLGRGEACDLVLSDTDASRRHIEILRRGSGVFVRDLGSKNGTKLDDSALEPGKNTLWARSSTLELGANRLRYEDPVADALEELERAADEQLAPDELRELAEAETPPTSTAPPPASGLGSGAGSRQAPVVSPPSRPRPPAKTQGYDATDWIVVLLSLVVLGLSAVGLMWLFGSE